MYLARIAPLIVQPILQPQVSQPWSPVEVPADLVDLRGTEILRDERPRAGIPRRVARGLVCVAIASLVALAVAFAGRHVWRRIVAPEAGWNRMAAVLTADVPIEVRPFWLDGPYGTYETGFKILCTADKGVVIQDVIYNSNYHPRIVYLLLEATMKLSDDRYPIRLTIGESMRVGCHYLHPFSPETYRKDVLYLDVVTDGGTFRFDQHGNLLALDPTPPVPPAPKPPTLEEQVFAECMRRWEEAKPSSPVRRPSTGSRSTDGRISRGSSPTLPGNLN
jgi:hypothetical protein